MSALDPLDLRVGIITKAEPNVKARRPALCLCIDFGPLGTLTSSAQITDHYSPENLVGRRVIAVVTLGSRLIAGFRSECLVLGCPDENQAVRLLSVDGEIDPGTAVF